MLTDVLHRLVAIPRVYDLVQNLAGAQQVRRRLSARIAQLGEARLILDLGGGTGMYCDLWPTQSTYICLDLDWIKLQGFVEKHPSGIPLLADVTAIPVERDSVDMIICTAVSHHLPEALLQRLVYASARVLKPAGTFVFLDAIYQPGLWAGRLLWKYDRGSHPHTAEKLHAIISTNYQIVHAERFSVYHEYLLCVGAKRVAQGCPS